MKGILNRVKFNRNCLLLGFFFCVLLTEFTFNYKFSFNYELEIQSHYYFLFFSYCLNLLLGFLWLFRARDDRSSSYFISFLSTTIAVNIFYIFSEFYSFSNEHFSMIAVATFSFFLFLHFKDLGLKLFLYLLLSFWVMQSFFVLIQVLEGKVGNDLTGTFQNSGVLSLYLMLHIPFFAYVVFKCNFERVDKFIVKHCTPHISLQRVKIFLFVLCAVYVFGIAILANARTSIMSALIVTASWIFVEHKRTVINKIKGISTPYVIALSIVSTSFILYMLYLVLFQKRMSAFGRLLAWDITLERIDTISMKGTGLGRFTYYYPFWQAEYFKNTVKPLERFFLSAGESYIIFNEHLQLVFEIGLPGFILWTVYLFYFYSAKSTHFKSLVTAIKLTITFILVSAFTTYPFHINIIIFIMTFCFAFMEIIRNNSFANYFCHRYSRLLVIFVVPAYFLLTAKALQLCYKNMVATLEWRSLDPNESTVSEIRESYDVLYNVLGSNGKFLTNYAVVLYNDNKYEQSKEIMQKARRYFISRNMVERFVSIYIAEKDHNKAIQWLEWLTNYIPNLFKPRYELFNEYLAVRDYERAKLIGQTILSMPIKVPSEEVDRIRREVELVVSKLDVDHNTRANYPDYPELK